ncbi:hypothetical protein TNCV_58421 [Trichonephila clavipes]|nr:hypothetical protein TNCV_58421 [Trichonephila clavipes]
MILCVAELLKDRRRAKNNRCCQEFDIAHSVVSRLWMSFKTTGMCSRRHGEVVLEVRRLKKTDISSYQQKEQTHHSSAGDKSVSAASESRSPENCCQTFDGRRTIRTQTCCVSLLTRQHRTARLQRCREHHN